MFGQVHPAQIDFEGASHLSCRPILEHIQIKDLVLFGIDGPFNPIGGRVHQILFPLLVPDSFQLRTGWIWNFVHRCRLSCGVRQPLGRLNMVLSVSKLVPDSPGRELQKPAFE